MIYQEFLGSKDVHVFVMHDRLGSFACVEKGEWGSFDHRSCECELGDFHGVERVTRAAHGVPGLRTYKQTGIRVLPMLQSCRVLYSEFVDFLYRSRLFTIRDIDTIPLLALCIRTQRLNSITSIRIDGRYMRSLESYGYPVSYISSAVARAHAALPSDSIQGNGGTSTWAAACSVLSQMKGLKNLWIYLGHNAFGMELCSFEGEVPNEEMIFGPLRRIKGLEVFEVEVEWETLGTFDEKAERPFRLRRRTERWGDFNAW